MSKAAVDGKFKAERECRLCLRSWTARPLTRHRVIPGRLGGMYVPQNCVPLCRPCHDLVDNRDLPTRLSARRMLRASLWPVEHAYALKMGAVFDELYPKPTRELVLDRRTRRRLAS